MRRKSTGVLYAMKILKKGDVVRKRQVERTKIERRVLGNVEHPFLMRLHYAFQVSWNSRSWSLCFCRDSTVRERRLFVMTAITPLISSEVEFVAADFYRLCDRSSNWARHDGTRRATPL